MGLGVGRVAIERIARWWTSASQEERFAFLSRVIAGEEKAPTLGQIQVAIYLAEAEAGEIDQG